MNRAFVTTVSLGVFGLLLPAYVSVVASNYDANWVFRTKITFSGYNKPETLTNFPVLVQLGPGITNFSYSQFGSLANAADLRFLSEDGLTSLDYEIEQWNTNMDGTAVVPTAIPGCTLWLEADAGILTNTTGVSAWLDQSGRGFHATTAAGSEPSYLTNALNGRPVIRFDGVTNCLRNTGWTPGFNVSGQMTYFFVSKIISPSSNPGFFAQRASAGNDYDNAGSMSIELTGGATRGLRYYHAGNPSIDVVRDNSMFRIDVMKVDANGTQVYLDGVLQGTSVTSFASQMNPVEYAIGVRLIPGISAFAQADFAEILLYNSALSSNQMSQVGLYLSEKYGLSTAYKRSGQSVAWVRVPALTNNASIWAYWGNPGQTNSPLSTTNGTVWNANYKAVWHMGETNVQDWTSNGNVGTSYTNATIEGLVGGAQNFAGNAFVDLGNRPSLNITGSLTISAWLYHNTGLGWSFAYSAGDGASWSCDYGITASNKWGLECSLSGGSIQPEGGSSVSELKGWHHVVFVYDDAAGKAYVYHDGVQAAVSNASGTVRSSNQFIIGAKNNKSVFWNSPIDEMRISSVASSSNWIWACWLNQASNRIFNTYGIVEKTKRGTVMVVR